MKFYEFGTIQDKCKGCPQLARVVELYDAKDDEINELVDAGLDGTALEMYRDLLVRDDQIPVDIAGMVTDDQSKQIKDEIVTIVDHLTEEHDLEAELIDLLQQTCEDGVFKLHAKRRGMQVTVSLCMSEMLYTFTKGRGWEPTTVERKNIE